VKWKAPTIVHSQKIKKTWETFLFFEPKSGPGRKACHFPCKCIFFCIVHIKNEYCTFWQNNWQLGRDIFPLKIAYCLEMFFLNRNRGDRLPRNLSGNKWIELSPFSWLSTRNYLKYIICSTMESHNSLRFWL